MTKNIYFFRDVKTGEYDFYGVFVNDAVAIRAFKKACEDPNVFKEDLELYRTCAMDTVTGKMTIFWEDTPEFIWKEQMDVSK